ncbi:MULTISPECIES: aminotransferase class IV [unclassified Prochlorococcus]|uniref:aminotransferase class IV n=1 Tax=unclassified Prochlorococcus TaxID=2627481 RepID=UPI000533AC67|nr:MULTISPECIES: aminotransferase class IV [unclassified Prochlorococcus]KGG14526.1 Aminodeoxychorismate lyase [Prochlorococcus sp. MIT 0602]KGG16049.1 Aminodeoxychorismate lyase [Prochlorococcus sp. MIT 0603]
MKENIAIKTCWINGHWIYNDDVKLPMNDRGITLGDGLFETILILQSTPQLLDDHIERWKQSAILLGMIEPPDKEFLLPLIKEAINRTSLIKGNGVLRLNWSRGTNNNRGIQFPTRVKKSSHKFWLELNRYSPCFKPVSTIISRHEQRNAKSRLSQCKTFNYCQSIQARNESNLAGYDDALLLSTSGEIACGTTANLLIKRNGSWLTPRKESGCLPGIMRQQGLNSGLFQEAKISPKPEPNDIWLLINSLSCHPLTKLNDNNLKKYDGAELLWQSLITNKN